jgi:hypothetical protein
MAFVIAITAMSTLTNRYAAQYFNKARYLEFEYTYSGMDWIAQILGGHPRRCPTILGMSVEAFKQLSELLQSEGLIAQSCYISVEVKLAVALYILRNAASLRQAMELVQHSLDTVSR